jgi:hypothetical protein
MRAMSGASSSRMFSEMWSIKAGTDMSVTVVRVTLP